MGAKCPSGLHLWEQVVVTFGFNRPVLLGVLILSSLHSKDPGDQRAEEESGGVSHLERKRGEKDLFLQSYCPFLLLRREVNFWILLKTWRLTAQTGEVKPSTAACTPSDTKGMMFSPKRVSLYRALRMFRAWTWGEGATQEWGYIHITCSSHHSQWKVYGNSTFKLLRLHIAEQVSMTVFAKCIEC